MTIRTFPVDTHRRVDLLRVGGYLADLDAGRWTTSAQRLRAYAAADRLTGLTGPDAISTVAELRVLMNVIDRAGIEMET